MESRSSLRRRIELSRRRATAWRPTGPRLWGLLRSMVTSYLALGVTLYILPGRQSSGPLAVLGLVLAVAVVGVLLRPVLAGLTVVLGSFGLLLLGFLSQAIILDVAIALAPDLNFTSRPEVILVSWVAASVAAVVNLLLDAGSEDAFLSQLLGRAVRVAHRQDRAAGPVRGGLLVIQFDGVSEHLLRQAITAGEVPTLSGWLRSQSHALRGWHTGLPATTPAGQAVLLHGDVTEVPSFRWFEKESGRLLVANHPRDAAEIERRISTGHGLLADGGVSVSNLFSGDAPIRLLTMSDARLPSRRTRGLASFATTRGGLMHSVVVFAGQVITELYQARRQRHRDVQPRVRRGGLFALERAVTTALLRDLTVAIVTEQIARAAPVIFVDFVDYDEVAHRAGPSRPESMRTLDGLDRLVEFFAEVIRETRQHYEIAIVSDHGQAQGATFAQLGGKTLREVVAALAADTVAPSEATLLSLAGADSVPAERWGSANLLLTGVARSDGMAARAVTRGHTGATLDADPEITLGGPPTQRPEVAVVQPPLVVAAAGSLAHIYLADLPGRANAADIAGRYPRLIEGLARHPHIGAVMIRSASTGAPAVIGTHGWRLLTAAGAVGGEGEDPVTVYGPQAAADLLSLDGRRHVGDVVVLGRFDPSTGEVAAFEELVGSHGGLGGGQTGAVLVHPATWAVPTGRVLSGLDVHELLRSHLPTQTRRDDP